MAYGILYTAQFKDRLSAITFKVDILQDGYGGGATTIDYMGTSPATLKYKSEKGKDQYVIGSSFQFNFKSLPADNDKYDALFEGDEKEFKVNYYKDASLIWTGYLQPDNLSRSLLDEVYEIQLNASDWLANLKDVEFRNGSTSYVDNALIFDTIKVCLGFTGLELDFYVQMNTYETTYMSTSTEVFNVTYIDLARFTKTVSGKTKYTSVYDVLTYLIKSFNSSLKQVDGRYRIINDSELESIFRLYDWATLTGGTQTASARTVDITNFTLEKNSNKTKLKPELRLDFKRNSKDIGGELVADTNDFEGTGPWTINAPDGSNRTVDDQITLMDSNPATNNIYIRTATPSQTATSSLYIKITFDIQFTTTPELGPLDKTYFHVRVTKPVSGQSSMVTILGSSLYHYESLIGDMFAIDETGVYTIEISPSDPANDYTSASIVISSVRINSVNVGSPEFDQNYIAYIDQDAQVKEDEIYFSDTNTNTDQGGFKVFSTSYLKTLAWNRDGETDGLAIHEIFALNLLKNRQAYKDLLTIGVYDNDFDLNATSIVQIDSTKYKIIEIETVYVKNIQRIMIEELLTSDPSYTFTSSSLTTINGEQTSSDDPTGSGTLHANLDGLAADDHTQYHNNARGDARYYQKSELYTKTEADARYYTQTQVDANTYTQTYINTNIYTKSEHVNVSAGAGDSGKPIVLDAGGKVDDSMINDGDINHGLLSGLAIDDHAQYHTDARGDARYYTQAQIIAAYWTSAYIAANFYNKTEADARYYTQTQVDTNFYTKTASDAKYAILATENNFTENQGIDKATLENWHGNFSVLELGNQFSLAGRKIETAGGYGYLSQNAYNDEVWKYLVTDEASQYKQIDGTHIFSVAVSGTADTAITWSNALEILNGGQVKFRYHRAKDTNGIDFQISSGSTYWKMENDGDFHCEGDVIAFSTTVSDKRLKQNIRPLESALEKICKLAGVNFEYRNKNETHVGHIAQDVLKVIPEIVIKKKLALRTNDNKKYYVIRYTELIPYVIEAIKELSLKVNVLINNFSILVRKIDKTTARADENDNEIKRLKHEINLLKKQINAG